MKVDTINSYNYSKYNVNKRKVSGYSDINFSGNKQALVAVAKEDFKTETAKKLYSTMQTWFKRIGTAGKIEDVKIFSEEIELYNAKALKRSPVNVDTLMSIRKDTNRSFLKLYRVFPEKKKQCVFTVDLDKNGQMVSGEYLIYNNLKFARDAHNIRRINPDQGRAFLPHGDNDREWGLPPEIIPGSEEGSEYGLFEIFIELARLHTSLYK